MKISDMMATPVPAKNYRPYYLDPVDISHRSVAKRTKKAPDQRKPINCRQKPVRHRVETWQKKWAVCARFEFWVQDDTLCLLYDTWLANYSVGTMWKDTPFFHWHQDLFVDRLLFRLLRNSTTNVRVFLANDMVYSIINAASHVIIELRRLGRRTRTGWIQHTAKRRR